MGSSLVTLPVRSRDKCETVLSNLARPRDVGSCPRPRPVSSPCECFSGPSSLPAAMLESGLLAADSMLQPSLSFLDVSRSFAGRNAGRTEGPRRWARLDAPNPETAGTRRSQRLPYARIPMRPGSVLHKGVDRRGRPTVCRCAGALSDGSARRDPDRRGKHRHARLAAQLPGLPRGSGRCLHPHVLTSSVFRRARRELKRMHHSAEPVVFVLAVGQFLSLARWVRMRVSCWNTSSPASVGRMSPMALAFANRRSVVEDPSESVTILSST